MFKVSPNQTSMLEKQKLAWTRLVDRKYFLFVHNPRPHALVFPHYTSMKPKVPKASNIQEWLNTMVVSLELTIK